MARIAVFVLLLSIIGLALGASDALARGWDDARTLSKENGKPIMVIIHKTWCGACKRLKPEFAESSEILELSSKFNLVNLQDDEEPSDSEFKPDGGYIPRILYIDPATQKVRADIYNKEGSDKYKYFYSDASAVVTGMRAAVAEFKA